MHLYNRAKHSLAKFKICQYQLAFFCQIPSTKIIMIVPDIINNILMIVWKFKVSATTDVYTA